MSTKKSKDASAPAEKAGAGRAPVKAFHDSDVSASIFAREYNGRTFYSVSFTRRYKDAKGAWRYVKSFDVNDLGRLVTVAQQAAEWLHGRLYPEPEALK